jgi:hypothetical protein
VWSPERWQPIEQRLWSYCCFTGARASRSRLLTPYETQDGHDTDLPFGENGTYAIKTTTIGHGKTLRDQFTYEVKRIR